MDESICRSFACRDASDKNDPGTLVHTDEKTPCNEQHVALADTEKNRKGAQAAEDEGYEREGLRFEEACS
ncbi:hypothetical protein EGYY_07440 [Eggerthella sp. YY7918]|nr:hypothetical protein EGYY_07440 [Eggerthella sp. YY7918]